jgi:hypothetical protein
MQHFVHTHQTPSLTLKLQEVLVGYHAHCTDGMVAAYSAAYFGVPTENMHALAYGDPLPEVFSTWKGPIVFLDFRPRLDALVSLAGDPERQGRVFVVDHHKNAYEEACAALKAPGLHTLFTPSASPQLPEDCRHDVGPNLVYIFDNDHSGARLAWDFFQGASHFVAPRRHIVDLAEDYDLWRKKLPLTEEFHIMTSTQKLTFELLQDLDRTVTALMATSTRPRWPEALERLQMRQDLVSQALERVNFTDLDGVVPGARFPMVNSNVFRNEVATALLERGYEVAVVWAHVDGGKYSYSLRSKDVDVDVIARLFGGNGHARAAGFVRARPFTVLP